MVDPAWLMFCIPQLVLFGIFVVRLVDHTRLSPHVKRSRLVFQLLESWEQSLHTEPNLAAALNAWQNECPREYRELVTQIREGVADGHTLPDLITDRQATVNDSQWDYVAAGVAGMAFSIEGLPALLTEARLLHAENWLHDHHTATQHRVIRLRVGLCLLAVPTLTLLFSFLPGTRFSGFLSSAPGDGIGAIIGMLSLIAGLVMVRLSQQFTIPTMTHQ